MTTTTCPTPTKSRFATRKAAESSARRVQLSIGTLLQPYLCEEACGWWHLTSHARPKQPDREPTSAEVEAVRAMGDEDFRELVANDARGGASQLRSRILRNPSLAHRWIATLKALNGDIAVQFAERVGRTDVHTRQWRIKATAFQAAVSQRRAEATLIAGALNRVTPSRNASQREQRAAAGENAIQRLIDAHQREFTQLLVEEYARLDLELPNRIRRYQELHAEAEAS